MKKGRQNCIEEEDSPSSHQHTPSSLLSEFKKLIVAARIPLTVTMLDNYCCTTTSFP